MKSLRQSSPMAFLLCGSILLAGCFETALKLGTVTDSTRVDPRYCGDWRFEWKDGDQPASASLVLRNFDGKQYYAEWKDKNDTLRMSGFLIPIKDEVFAQLSPMKADGELAPKHLIMKVKLDGDKLTLTNLKEDFFKDVTTDEALRKKVEENLSNPAMYEDVGTGSRASQP